MDGARTACVSPTCQPVDPVPRHCCTYLSQTCYKLVTNLLFLTGDVTEGDLHELFRPFGPISRVFLAVDRATGENRGFAFVNYHVRCVLGSRVLVFKCLNIVYWLGRGCGRQEGRCLLCC